MKLNKKLWYIFTLIILGLFVVSACQSEVGARIRKVEDIESPTIPIEPKPFGVNIKCFCGDDPADSCTGTFDVSEGVAWADCTCCESTLTD